MHVHAAAHLMTAAMLTLQKADDPADKEYEDYHHDFSKTAAAMFAVGFVLVFLFLIFHYSYNR